MIFLTLKMVKSKSRKEASRMMFYFVIGEKDMKDLDSMNDKHYYIFDNTYMITTNFEKAKSEVDRQMKYHEDRNIFQKWFVYHPKYWRVLEIKSNLTHYDSKKEFYINKKTLQLTQVEPTENKNEFVKYKLESWCGTTLVNGCSDSDEDD